MSTEHEQFFQDLDPDNITPEQAAQMLEFGWEGDTDSQEPETGGDAPDTSTDTDDNAEQDAEQAENEQAGSEEPAGEPEGEDPAPVLLAKDGKHTIPYDKLVEAREGERHWREQAEAASRELEALKQQAQARAEAGETPTETDKNAAIAQNAIDEGIDPDIFGDFTEEDLAKGVSKLVELKLEQRLQQMEQQKAQEQVQSDHYGAIYQAHPDADSIVESAELDTWIKGQPGHVQIGIKSVLERGSAQQVIEVFDSFKQATGKAQAADTSSDVKAAAKAAIDSAEPDVSASLSDIPGGRAGGLSLEEQVAAMEGKDLLERMADMPPEQIESLLNKLI